MLSSFWEDSGIPNLQGGSIQHIVVAYEARVDRSFYNQQCLRCERVGVQWEHSTDSAVEMDVRTVLCVEPWELVHGCECEFPICAREGAGSLAAGGITTRTLTR